MFVVVVLGISSFRSSRLFAPRRFASPVRVSPPLLTRVIRGTHAKLSGSSPNEPPLSLAGPSKLLAGPSGGHVAIASGIR